MKISELDFELPESLIAQRPLEKRGFSRLLVLKKDGTIRHSNFSNITEFLAPGDMLIINNTKVLPVRLEGRKPTGGRIDLLLVEPLQDGYWRVLTKSNYRGTVTVSEELKIELLDRDRGRLIFNGDLNEILLAVGHMPLPPYIKRKPLPEDREWYQTVYAEVPGSVAAPTAGLHFTEEIIDNLKKKGILIRKLTLHVGPGTFRLIRTEDIEKHRMESEVFEIPFSLINEIEEVKKSGRRIIATGTTTTRALEGYASKRYMEIHLNGTLKGTTDLFIYPGYEFKIIDGLITNFHLPRSTPLLLVAALCGVENLKRAYREAIAMGYRFFSYGDAMLII
ncbi:MAG: tRNA preQ1(34) S-adenosylmethionine ribosyltransferase-isomerase QueA [Thermodesulfovibrionales bacterium]|nr:tRNA preQ1(34) S-adenosylmethionine ribosyltransferase-isomerase QueA [Thermodesulfovibrionales bacterium]